MNNKRLSFLLFAYWHDPRWTLFVGASVKIRDLAVNLAESGHDVRLFLPKYGFSKAGLPVAVTEIPLVDLPGLRSISYNLFLLYYLIAHWHVLRPDVVYLRRTSLIVPLLYARFKRAKFFFEVNDDPFVNRLEEGSRVTFRLRKFLSEAMDRVNIDFADRCFVISPAVIEKIKKRMPEVRPDKMMVMPSGANTDLMRPMEKQGSCHKIGLDVGNRYVGFAGSLLGHQGLECLIEATPDIIKEVPAVRFVIVGEGPMRKTLEEQVSGKKMTGNFIFTGEIDYDFLPAWINAMDVCVAPYSSDAGLRSPVKIFDYLACGKPVVASDVSGITGIFKGAPLMVLVPPDSSGPLAGTIREILTAPDPTMAERTAAHQWIAARFDRRMVAGQVAEEAVRMIEKRK